MTTPLLPGARIGVLGSGQLGRMLALAARRLGYRVHVLADQDDSPAGQVADLTVKASYDDADRIREFAGGVDVMTFEFENVSAAAAAAAASAAIVRPDPRALEVAQHRIREKTFLADLGLPVTPFAAVGTEDDLRQGLSRLGRPAVLKTAAFGYDGKGQIVIGENDDPVKAWDAIGRHEAVLEAFINLDCEISIVGARAVNGTTAFFDAFENVHRHHILDVTTAPADVPEVVRAEAVAVTHAVLDALGYVGVLCIEFFVTRDARLLINEIAPRTHNSGHLTIDACHTSQFEQQVRAVCGLPLGSPALLQPAAMANLLGDVWSRGEPDWAAALAYPEVKLHLYGKTSARPGRKMGHLTAMAATTADARRLVIAARDALLPR